MTNEPSPRPWRVHEIEHQVLQQQFRGLCHAIFDSRDRIVAIPTSCREDADFIVDAVNEREHLRAQLAATVSEALAIREERDRLRDLVKRLSRHLANYLTSESENDLLRESRAAIGEAKE